MDHKFVNMNIINNVFEDVPIVDYITVTSVTDSQVHLLVHLKTSKLPDKDSFYDRTLILGKMLNRTVILAYAPASKFRAFLFKLGWLT